MHLVSDFEITRVGPFGEGGELYPQSSLRISSSQKTGLAAHPARTRDRCECHTWDELTQAPKPSAHKEPWRTYTPHSSFAFVRRLTNKVANNSPRAKSAFSRAFSANAN